MIRLCKVSPSAQLSLEKKTNYYGRLIYGACDINVFVSVRRVMIQAILKFLISFSFSKIP